MSNYWLDKLEMWTNRDVTNERHYIIAQDQDDATEIIQKMVDKSIISKSLTFWCRMDDSEKITYVYYARTGLTCTRSVGFILKNYERGHFYTES